MVGSRTAWMVLLGGSVWLPATGSAIAAGDGVGDRPGTPFAAVESVAPGQAPTDSATLNGQGRGAQARFERTRALHAPLTWRTFSGPCDERLGRFCLTLGRDGPEPSEAEAWVPPPEDPRVTEGRDELLDLLARIASVHPGDRWVLEQRVAYLGEAGRWDEALEVARGCGLVPEESWRCHALQGLSLHSLSDFEGAEAAFDAALGAMDAERAAAWRDPSMIAAAELRGRLRTGATGAIDVTSVTGDSGEWDEAMRLHARYWTMANPLYLVPGNDRWTEHLARHTLAVIRSDARNAYQMRWGDDLAELLVRYGPEVAFEQERAPALHLGPPPLVGRMDRNGRGMLPEREHFEDPASIPIGAWRTDRRSARERHAPEYAPRIGSMEVQQARFRRGDDLFLVLGWMAAPFPDPVLDATAVPEVGLFIHDAKEMAPIEFMGGHAEGTGAGPTPSGVATARIPAGAYVVSMEVLERQEGRAWRARHGVVAESLPRGVPSLSDLILLAPAEGPGTTRSDIVHHGSLEENLHRVLSGLQLDSRVAEVGWEVYSLAAAGPVVGYGLSVEPVDRGLLRRTAEFLRLAAPPPMIDIAWEEAVDASPSGAGAEDGLGDRSFRSLVVDLSTLPAGPTRIELTMRLPGREPVTARVIADLPE